MQVIVLAAAAAVVVDPGSSDWVRTPDPSAWDSYYPVAARLASVSGAASVRCSMSREGSLAACAVLTEAPAGWGFGDAALGLSAWYRLGGSSRERLAESGADLEIPMSFQFGAEPNRVAAAQPRRIKGIDRQHWANVPSLTEMIRAHPKEALSAGAGGSGVIDCIIGADGRLNPCSLVSEQPARTGFGAAALRLAAKFQVKPAHMAEAGLEGAVFRIPIRFSQPSR